MKTCVSLFHTWDRVRQWNANETQFKVGIRYKAKIISRCWLLTNKLGLICTLVDRCYTINNAWLGFHEDIKKLTDIHKESFSSPFGSRVVNRYLTLTRNECTTPVSVSDTTTNFYFKLPYVGPFSVVTQKRVHQFAKCYCNSIDIKLVFSSFKIGDLFGVKDPIPRGLRTWAKPLDIYPHAFMSTWSVIGPLTFSDIYIILHNVALFVLMSVLTP